MQTAGFIDAHYCKLEAAGSDRLARQGLPPSPGRGGPRAKRAGGAQKIAGESRGDRLTGQHWQQFARECGLNPKQVLERVGALAKAAIKEAAAAEAEVAAMPAGGHEILVQTREAVERRAHILLAG